MLAGGALMLVIGLGCGIGGVLAGGYVGDKVGRHRKGGHSLVVGISLLIAVPLAAGCLLVLNKPSFALLTIGAVFMLSVYNGPSAVVVDQLAPIRYAATLQAVFLFGSHVVGDTPAAAIVGLIGAHATIAHSLLVSVVAFALSGVLFIYASRRQARERSFHHDEDDAPGQPATVTA